MLAHANKTGQEQECIEMPSGRNVGKSQRQVLEENRFEKFISASALAQISHLLPGRKPFTDFQQHNIVGMR